MYAIIETGGKQFKVRRDARICIPSIGGEVGERVVFDRVVFASDGERITAGTPVLDRAKVVGEIVRHGRDDKITVFKYKRRHRYRRKQGHRQGYTEVAITGLELEGGPAAPDESSPEADDIAAGEIGTGGPDAGGRHVGPYVCEECGRGFATERGLQQHRAKAHVA